MNEIEIIRIAVEGELEFRDDVVDGVEQRIVSGKLAPYGTPAEIWGGRAIEVLKAGSMTKTIQERGHALPIYLGHDRVGPKEPIGRAVALEERGDGVYGSFKISDTARGRDASTLIRDRVATGFSIEFQPLPGRSTQERAADGRTIYHRSEVRLHGVALTPSPAYSDAKVLSYRSEDGHEIEGTPRLVAARNRLILLSR